jgi:hypothetical protein
MAEAYKTKHFMLEDLINLAFYGEVYKDEFLHFKSSANA